MALSEKWKLSVFEYHVDSFIVPLLFCFAISLAPVVLWQMALGVFSWSLTEYCLHRFLFHHHFRRDHWAHHVHPQAYIGISGVYVAALSAVMLAPAFLLRMTSLYGGFMLGYFIYLLLHYTCTDQVRVSIVLCARWQAITTFIIKRELRKISVSLRPYGMWCFAPMSIPITANAMCCTTSVSFFLLNFSIQHLNRRGLFSYQSSSSKHVRS